MNGWIRAAVSVLAVWCCGAGASARPPTGGALEIVLGAGGDTHICVPFQREPEAVGRVRAVGVNFVKVDSTWSPGRFRPTATARHYAQFASGALAGVWYAVADSTADTLLLETEGDNLAAHPLGALSIDDVVRVGKFWTVGDVLGWEEGTLAVAARTNVAVPADDVVVAGFGPLQPSTRAGSSNVLHFVTGLGWRREGAPTGETNVGWTAVPPGSVMTIRRRSGGARALQLAGELPWHAQVVRVPGGSGKVSRMVSVGSMAGDAVSLGESGLDTAVTSSSSPSDRVDEVWVHPVGQEGYHGVPDRFVRVEGIGWRRAGSTNDAGGHVLMPGQAIEIRKRPEQPRADWVQPALP